MKRSNFFKALFGVPLIAKELVSSALPKDKDGFYIDKKEFENEVRDRVPYSKLGNGITIYDTNYMSAIATTAFGTGFNNISRGLYASDYEELRKLNIIK